MDFNTLLLIAIVWQLWRIHQDLMEHNDRQRDMKIALCDIAKLAEQPRESPHNDHVEQ